MRIFRAGKFGARGVKKSNYKRQSLILMLSVLLSGCAHSLHQYYVSDSSLPLRNLASDGKEISAEAEQFVILFITGNTDYADQAYSKLLAQCPHGEIVGINARYSTSLGFLSYYNKIHLRGICVSGA